MILFSNKFRFYLPFDKKWASFSLDLDFLIGTNTYIYYNPNFFF